MSDGTEPTDAASFAEMMRKEARNRRKEEAQLAEEAEKKAAEKAPVQQEPQKEASTGGLVVNHDMEALGDGVLLTLKDQPMLDKHGNLIEDEMDDVLENADLVRRERREFQEQRAKAQNVYEAAADPSSALLPQYADEKESFEKYREKRKFRLDETGSIDTEKLKREEAAAEGKIRVALDDSGDKQFIWSKVQSDTFTAEEVAKFRKPRKRVVKKKKQVDAQALEAMLAADEAADDAVPPPPPVDEEADEAMRAMAEGAELARKAKAQSAKALSEAELVRQLEHVEEEKPLVDSGSALDDLRLTRVAADDDDDDAKRAEKRRQKRAYGREEELRSIDASRRELLEGATGGDETNARTTAGALRLLQEKGLMKKAVVGRANDASINDGAEGGIAIKYVDEFGRELSQKEAFRQHSYKFHGKDPSLASKARTERNYQKQMSELKGGAMEHALRTAEATRAAQVAAGGIGIVGTSSARGSAALETVGSKRRAEMSLEAQMEKRLRKGN